MNKQKTFLIFRKKTVRIDPELQVVSLADLMQRVHSGEGMELPQRPEKPKFKNIIQFLKTVTSVKEVAEIVRANPLEEYVLFEGVMHEISTPIHVLIDGKSADTMEDEWAVDPSIEISEEIRNLVIDEADADLEIEARQ